MRLDSPYSTSVAPMDTTSDPAPMLWPDGATIGQGSQCCPEQTSVLSLPTCVTSGESFSLSKLPFLPLYKGVIIVSPLMGLRINDKC